MDLIALLPCLNRIRELDFVCPKISHTYSLRKGLCLKVYPFWSGFALALSMIIVV